MDDEAMKAMARRICARIIEGDSDNPVRVMKANRYLSGDLDDDHHMAIALATIIETQEHCAVLVERTHMGDLQFPPQSIPRAETVAAIRSGQQFRKDV